MPQVRTSKFLFEEKPLTCDAQSSKIKMALTFLIPILPTIFAIYEMALFQLKLFMSLETIQKQQAALLDILEKQNDAVIVFEEQPSAQPSVERSKEPSPINPIILDELNAPA